MASTSPDASTADVGAEVVRLLDLPFGSRPHRVLIDFQRSGLERITDRVADVTEEVLTAMGVGEMLHVAARQAA